LAAARLLEEASERFPEARAALMLSDPLSGPHAAAELTEAMTERRFVLGLQPAIAGQQPDASPGTMRSRSTRVSPVADMSMQSPPDR
jgi:hypothetical protein